MGQADAVILASPVYRGSFTGALKNLLDHLPIEALTGKPVGIVAMGATNHHYLGVDWHLRDVLAWFGAIGSAAVFIFRPPISLKGIFPKRPSATYLVSCRPCTNSKRFRQRQASTWALARSRRGVAEKEYKKRNIKTWRKRSFTSVGS